VFDPDGRDIHRWPRLYLSINSIDGWDRHHVEGYAYVDIPSYAGMHTLSVDSWRPVATIRDRMRDFYTGGSLQLASMTYPPMPYALPSRVLNQHGFQTEVAGKVNVRFNVVVQHAFRPQPSMPYVEKIHSLIPGGLNRIPVSRRKMEEEESLKREDIVRKARRRLQDYERAKNQHGQGSPTAHSRQGSPREGGHGLHRRRSLGGGARRPAPVDTQEEFEDGTHGSAGGGSQRGSPRRRGSINASPTSRFSRTSSAVGSPSRLRRTASALANSGAPSPLSRQHSGGSPTRAESPDAPARRSARGGRSARAGGSRLRATRSGTTEPAEDEEPKLPAFGKAAASPEPSPMDPATPNLQRNPMLNPANDPNNLPDLDDDDDDANASSPLVNK